MRCIGKESQNIGVIGLYIVVIFGGALLVLFTPLCQPTAVNRLQVNVDTSVFWVTQFHIDLTIAR